MIRFYAVLVACLLAASSLSAQNRPHYNLLWKISGNGLTAPSYLFGTMHVEDERAFEFSDSVLLKISECKAFSLEVHPDSLVRLLLPILAGQSSKGRNKFKDLLSEKDYAKIDSLMRKRTGLSLDRLKSPSMVRMFLEKKTSKKGKGATVDGFLYNIARRQGKTIMGIEDAHDQLAALDDFAQENLSSELLRQLESDSVIHEPTMGSMIDLYYEGNIEAMSRYLKVNMATIPGYYDKLITHRNVGMTTNIVRQVREQPTFFAVGVGHLAGEEGLIYLLQQQGYTVQPVKATFTGLAKKYTYTAQEEPWYEYTSAIGAYKVSMPTKPITFKVDSVGLALQTYVDIGTSTVFQTTHISLHGQYKGKPAKYALDQFVDRLKKGGKYKIEKVSRVDVQGLEGREIAMREGSQFFRVQFLLRGDVVYMLQVAPTKAIAYSDDAEKFLRSFRLQEFGKTVWKDFSNAAGAFSAQMPSDIKTQFLETEAEGGGLYKINLYHATDIELGETYLLRYSDFPPGFRSLGDSVYYASLITNAMENMKGRNLQSDQRMIEGFKGMGFTFDVAEKVVVTGRIFLRGGRTYLLLAVGSKDATASGVDTFLESFRLLPTEKVVMQEFEFPLHHVKVKLPASFPKDSIGFAAMNEIQYTEDYGEYHALDAQSGAQYKLRITKLSAYAVAKDADDFFNTFNEDYADDSVRVTSRKRDGKVLEQKMEVTNARLNGMERGRVVVAGQYVYTLFVHSAHDADPAAAEAFFSSLKFPEATGTWNLFADKTDVLLQDVASTDTIVVDEALPELRTYKFTPAALPKIYAAITRANKPAEDRRRDARSALLRTLKQVHDESTIDFIKKLYPTLLDSMLWKTHALTALTSMKTQASSRAFLELLEKEQGKPELWAYSIMEAYGDSLTLLNDVLPGVMRSLDRMTSPERILWLTRQAIDSNALTPVVKKEVLALAVAKGQQRIATLPATAGHDADISEDDSYFYSLGDLLLLADPSEAVKSIFQELRKRPWLVDTRMVTLEFYLKNNLKLVPADLESMVSDPYYRIELYTLLKKFGQEKLYPAKYLSQEKFAEGALYQYMASEDGVPDKIKLVGVRSVRYKEQKQNLYVYQYQYEGDETWHIAFSGPFPEKTKYVEDTGDYTYATYTEYSKGVDIPALVAEVSEGAVEVLK